MAEKDIEIAKFSFNVDDVVESAAELKKAIDETKASTKELKDSQAILKKYGKEGSVAFQENAKALVENDAALKVLNKEYNNHVKALSENIKATQEAEIQQELMTLALSQEVTTIKEARDQNKLLNKLRNETNVTTDEGQAQLKLLNDKLDSNNKLVKDNADAYLAQKINVGNYKESIKDAFNELNIFNGGLTGFIARAQQAGGVGNLLTSSFKAITSGIYGMIKASLAFLATPIGAVIGVIGATLGLLVNYLKSTQSGIDAVTAVTRPLSAVFETLVGILQEVGEFLFKAFSEPKKTIDDLYQFVKKNVITTFENLYDILVGIATLDFAQAKKGFQGIADQATDSFNAVKDAAGGIVDRLSEAAKKGAEIDKLQKQIERGEIDIISLRAQTNLQLKEQENIAKNQLLTDEERKKAIDEQTRLTRNLIEAENAIVKAQIQQLEIKQSLNDTSREEEKELETLKAKILENNAKIFDDEKRNLGAVKQLNDNSAKAAQKHQEQFIQNQKTILNIYIATGSQRAKTLSEEIELEEEVSKRKIEILKQELKAKKLTQEEYALQVLEINNDLASKQAELAIETAAEELRIYKEGIDAKLEANQFLSDTVANQRQADNNLLLEQQQEFEALRLEQGLINQNEYDTAIREAREATRLENEAIDAERESLKREEQKELRAIAFEEELATLEEERATKFELEQAQLSEQRQLELDALNASREKGLLSEELFKARQGQIDSKYKKLELQREQILANQKVSAITGTIGAVASVVDKNSSAGKALGVAQALINTYQGISAGVKLGYPQAIPAVAAAAATGFKAVKDIAGQKLPSISGQGDVGGSGNITPSLGADLSSVTGQNVNLNSIAASGNSAVQNQIENQANLNGLSENVSQAVEQGARAGTAQGAETGMTNLSDNRQIATSSSF